MSERTDKTWRAVCAIGRNVGVPVALAVGIGVGALLYRTFLPPGGGPAGAAPTAAAPAEGAVTWTCSMHPTVRKSEPGLCPICNMDLIELEETDQVGSLREFSTSNEAMALMDIVTAPVERRYVPAEIRMVGKIEYDETRVAHIAAWVPGRLDKLYVNYTGMPIRAGDHLAKIYSPELLSAQEELLQAIEAVKGLADSNVGIVRETTEATVLSAREKLRLLGLKPEQIATIETSGKATDHLTIYSTAAGIVVDNHAQEGMYVTTGMRIGTIADLSQVWVNLDAYESDLMWLRYGQEVSFTAVSYPGETFAGKISFINPIMDAKTRTIKVRVNAPNAALKLKPGMFVKAAVRTEVAGSGRVMAPDLAGKWISPMHPEVIKDGPGQCDVCGMDLVRAETLGYVSIDRNGQAAPLVAPASAVLLTGTRAIVYVRIDPSLLQLPTVTDWPALLNQIRHGLAGRTKEGGILNTACPIMGAAIDPAHVGEDLTRPYGSGKVAFCCAGCPETWDKLTDAEKQQKLAAVSATGGLLRRFWEQLSPELRDGLLATPADKAPPAKLRHGFVGEVNALLAGDDFYDAAAFQAVSPPSEAQTLLRIGIEELPPRKVTRLNRLLLEMLLPQGLAKGKSGPTFEGREILLGPRAGDYYLVRSGLAEGDRVVVRGGFKIDSALQLQAKPSMMLPDPAADAPPGGHTHAHGEAPKTTGGKTKPAVEVPARFKLQLRAVLDAADAVEAAVAGKDIPETNQAFAELHRTVLAADKTLLVGENLLHWKELSMRLSNDGVEGGQADTLAKARDAAASLKRNVRSLKGRFAVVQDPAGRHDVPEQFRKQLAGLFDAYFAVQQALADDKHEAALAAATSGADALAAVEMKLLNGPDHEAWMPHASELKRILGELAAAKDIEAARQKFALLSEELLVVAKQFGPAGGKPLYEIHCPMAFNNRGARWLQETKGVRNPYFGSAMLECGSVTEIIEPVKPAHSAPPDEEGRRHE